MKIILLLLLIVCTAFSIKAQNELPIRGLAIAAPNIDDVDRFVKFIDEELAPRRINTLILRVGYKFKYKSHP